MNMPGYNNESQAVAFVVLELHKQKMDHNTLCMIIILQSSYPVTGKRHEKGMPFVIENPPPHFGLLVLGLMQWPSCPSVPGNKTLCRGHPPDPTG